MLSSLIHFQPTDNAWVLTANILIGLAACIFILHIIHRLSSQGRKMVIVGCTFLAGLFYSLEFYLPAQGGWFIWAEGRYVWREVSNPLSPWILPVGNAFAVAGAFTLGLGVINLCAVHAKRMAQARSGWHNSAAFFAALIAMTVFGIWQGYAPKVQWVRQVYEVLFDGMLVPLQSATFSLLAFYIASAAYRAFRVRTAEATLMMVAAFIVMLGQVPVGMWLTHGIPLDSRLAFLRVEALSSWLLAWVSMPALRAIGFGIAVGALAMALRIWLSLERGSFFEKEL